MPVLAIKFPEDWVAGADFIQIEDEEFHLVSEPQGLIAIIAVNDQGYLTMAGAKRLLVALTKAIENSESAPPENEEWDGHDDLAGKTRTDDQIPF